MVPAKSKPFETSYFLSSRRIVGRFHEQHYGQDGKIQPLQGFCVGRSRWRVSSSRRTSTGHHQGKIIDRAERPT